jgi:hypothetical protein
MSESTIAQTLFMVLVMQMRYPADCFHGQVDTAVRQSDWRKCVGDDPAAGYKYFHFVINGHLQFRLALVFSCVLIAYLANFQKCLAVVKELSNVRRLRAVQLGLDFNFQLVVFIASFVRGIMPSVLELVHQSTYLQ